MGARKDGQAQNAHGRGTCWQVADGWRCRVQVRGQKVYGKGSSETAARADMNKNVRALERGEKKPSRRIPPTIGSVGPLWLHNLRFTATAPGTLLGYLSLYRIWIGPMPAEYETRKRITPPKVDISKAPLATFGPDERRAWWGQMERKGASRSQIHNADAVLTGLLRAHKRLGIHPEVLDVDIITRPTVDRTPRRRPSAAEMLRLISFCSVDWTEDGEPREPYATIFTLKALTGCRIGELRGLHWGDIDEIRGGINVRVQMDKFTRQPRDTKGHAQRYISLDSPDSDAMQLLAAHKKRQQELGLPTGAGDLVFLYRRYPSVKPHVVSYFAIGSAFVKAREAAKLPADLTPHCLRHGSAMLSLRSGTDLVTLQRRLGHKDIATTAQYLEADGQLAQADASRLASALKRTPRTVRATG